MTMWGDCMAYLSEKGSLGLRKKGKRAGVQMLAQSERILALLDERFLPFVPDVEELLRWGRADEAGVNQTRKTHPCNSPLRKSEKFMVPSKLAQI